MNVRVFYFCVLAGWLLVLVGGVLIDVGVGLAVSGALLLLVAAAVVKLVGIRFPASMRR
ncbi:hypothetical protein KKP06_24685 [Ralstonia pickettii]|uniref:hypothetical protein n=1 Tax=Ralstonia pickettii TaxID=329 RepID=UPI001BE3FF66|nr:hypothetical protein [Ralstonia pickettii]MBT2181002.1 hypothetical protein [Ralstonia pickettii]